MGWCHVGADAGAKAVADLLMFNNSIAVLDLRGNGLGNAGAAQIARSLKEHTNDKLTELDLGYNEIKDEGACTLAQARPRTPLSGSLQVNLVVQMAICNDKRAGLTMGCNEIKNEGACTLAQALC